MRWGGLLRWYVRCGRDKMRSARRTTAPPQINARLSILSLKKCQYTPMICSKITRLQRLAASPESKVLPESWTTKSNPSSLLLQKALDTCGLLFLSFSFHSSANCRRSTSVGTSFLRFCRNLYHQELWFATVSLLLCEAPIRPSCFGSEQGNGQKFGLLDMEELCMKLWASSSSSSSLGKCKDMLGCWSAPTLLLILSQMGAICCCQRRSHFFGNLSGLWVFGNVLHLEPMQMNAFSDWFQCRHYRRRPWMLQLISREKSS